MSRKVARRNIKGAMKAVKLEAVTADNW